MFEEYMEEGELVPELCGVTLPHPSIFLAFVFFIGSYNTVYTPIRASLNFSWYTT